MNLKFLLVALVPYVSSATVPRVYSFPNSTTSHIAQTNTTTNATIQVHDATNVTLQTNRTRSFTLPTNETTNSTLWHHQQKQPQQFNTTIFRRDFAMDEMKAETDILLFEYPLKKFRVFLRDKYPPELDWTNNACSHAPDKPFGFPFKDCCQRHDFGYANYKRQGRFNIVSKKKIDINFQKDMEYKCDHYGGLKKGFCYVVAYGYYAAVRIFTDKGT